MWGFETGEGSGFGAAGPWAAAGVVLILMWSTAFLSFVLSRVLSRSRLLPDAPNARSSHRRVTPRSGGFAIFAAWLAAMGLATLFFAIMEGATPFLAFAAIALCAFTLGALDDWRTLPPLLKLTGQGAIAFLFVQVFGAIEVLPAPFIGEFALGVFAIPATVFWIVAFMNAYNFMDGVNGIAAVCAAFVAIACALAAALAGDPALSVIVLALGAALIGFTPVNLHEGRLFMGDSGSMSVGFILAAVGVTVTNATGSQVTALFLPTAFMPFLFDVAFTLVHRSLRGQSLLSAHREHLYQLLTQAGWTHLSTATLYLALTAFSTAVAFLMLTFPTSWQFLAPTALALALLVGAAPLFKRFVAMGLLNSPQAARLEDGGNEDASVGDAAIDQGNLKDEVLEPLVRAAE